MVTRDSEDPQAIQLDRSMRSGDKEKALTTKVAVDRAKKRMAERLAEVRGARSQRQFARELGVFQQNVNRYESGTTPHTDFLIQVALREQVSLDWLVLGKGRMKRGR
jgi:hypothetical protein